MSGGIPDSGDPSACGMTTVDLDALVSDVGQSNARRVPDLDSVQRW